jgi:hypothetical protein
MSYSPPQHGLESRDGNVSSPTGGLGSVLTPQNVSEANNFAKDRVAEFQQNVHQGNWSLRFLALLGGISMVIVSILGFAGHVVYLHWISALFELYTVALGALIIILEYGRQLSFFKGVESSLYKNALFLKYVWGRGVLYFVAGTLQISQRDMVSVIVGLYVCVVAVTFVVVGQRTARKLGELRRSAITPHQLQERFAVCDVESKGSLSIAQFQNLTNDLGMELTRNEVETAFLQLDFESQGRLRYEAVQKWWDQEATVPDDFQGGAIA